MTSFNKHTHQVPSFHQLLLLLIVLLFSITQFPVSSIACHEEERRALLSFKSSLDDPANRLSSWKEGRQNYNCCDWHGVGCSSDSFHVVSLDLRNRDLETFHSGPDEPWMGVTVLKGKLSPYLFNLTHLDYLDLGWNDFQESEISFQFANLTKLTYLDLSSSEFVGPITTQFGNRSSLEYLDLSCRWGFCLDFSSMKWVRQLVNLKFLSLFMSDLSTATSSEKNFAEHFSYLSNLEDLDLSTCRIDNPSLLIQEFRNLSRLSSINMNFNLNFDLNSTFPTHLDHLKSLSTLDLVGCDLYGFVPYLPQLRELDVSGNEHLVVNLTRIFEHQWPKLQNLSISDTILVGSLQDLVSNAPILVSLDAAYCSIQGSIPKSICKIPTLQRLNLYGNNITGTIPNCITDLKNLSWFGVAQNNIEGNVSLISLVNLLNLTALDLSSNRLTVDVNPHSHLYSKHKLETLRLQSCNLNNFPAFICNSIHLRALDLSYNNLTGALPFCFYKLKFFKLDLSYNKLHGPLPIPPRYSKFYNLAYNKFSGEIPIDLFGAYENYLSNNELSGSIPSSICSNDSDFNPQYIDLSYNKLSGVIPTSIGYCSYLFSLNLANNNLTGNVPVELEQAYELEFLQLHFNKLDGPLPSFGSPSLRVLNLAHNRFEGSIPISFVPWGSSYETIMSGFDSLYGLRILSLRSNNLSGPIPEEITSLQKLQLLDLSMNNLSGPIPQKLGNWSKLTGKSYESMLYDYSTLQPSAPNYYGGTELDLVIKGIVQYQSIHSYNTAIDLSCNNLDGNIPKDIGLLRNLYSLNLSHNHFSHDIPMNIGNMSNLGSLDLSFNELSGHIPQSLTLVDSLGVINLSYNKLSGRIPRGKHFDTLALDGSAFIGNDLLCGEPTTKVCKEDQQGSSVEAKLEAKADKKDATEKLCLFASVALGFIVGFWGLFFVLLVRKEQWWFPYWKRVGIIAVRVAKMFA